MEKFDVYDKNGNKTGRIKTDSDEFTGDEYILGSSLWLVNKSGELLIQKRSMTKTRFPGMWSITGGAAKAGETSEQACLREVAEEIGLRLSLNDITLLYRTFGSNIIFDDYVCIMDFLLSSAILQVEEVSEIKFAGINEIKEMFFGGTFLINDITDLDKVSAYIQNIKS